MITEVNPVVLIAVVVGLVETGKKLGLNGNASLVFSLVTGVSLGVVLELTALYPEMSTWVQVGVGGLVMGLAASGLYDVGKKFTE